MANLPFTSKHIVLNIDQKMKNLVNIILTVKIIFSLPLVIFDDNLI